VSPLVVTTLRHTLLEFARLESLKFWAGRPSSSPAPEPKKLGGFSPIRLHNISIESQAKSILDSVAPVFIGTLDGTQVAVKIFFNMDNQAAALFSNEVQMLSKFSTSKAVVSVVGVGKFDECGVIVTKYVTNRSWANFVTVKPDEKLPLRTKLDIALQAANSLKEFHAQGVVFGCFTSSKVLIDEQFKVQLTGLNFCNIGQKSDIKSKKLYAIRHRFAPEVKIHSRDVLSDSCSIASDIYSFGIVLWEIMANRINFQPRGGIVLSDVSDAELAKLIERCLAGSASERPTLDEIIKTLTAAAGTQGDGWRHEGRKKGREEEI